MNTKSHNYVMGASTVTRATLDWVLKKLDEGEIVAIATVIETSGSVPGKPGAKLAFSSDGMRFGTVGGAGLERKVETSLEELLSRKDFSNKGKIESFMLHKDGKGLEITKLDSLCGGKVTISMEVILPMPHLLIVGGGHVGLSIANCCNSLGWKYSILDVRSEYSDEKRFQNASELHTSTVKDFLSLQEKDSLTRFSDILLLGHDWKIDQEMLIGILHEYEGDERPRIGAIGSKTKWSSFKKAAMEEGILEKRLDNVRCPIGIDIGADSPEEIAVAVCAEIIKFEKNKIFE